MSTSFVRSAAVLASVSALLFACAGLKEPITAAAGCTQMTAAVQAKCPGAVIDCNGFVACKAAKEWEKADTEACATNVKNAADCDAAQKVACAIACVEN